MTMMRVDILRKKRIIKAFLVDTDIAEAAIDTIRELNEEETEAGEPLYDAKNGDITLLAEPIEFERGVCEI